MPRGGARKGAGRKPGGTNALRKGEIEAVRVMKLRVPEGASPEAAKLADRCQQRLIDVMEEKVFSQNSNAVLMAAKTLREEICGPVKQKVEHTLATMTDEQLEARFQALAAKASAGGEG